MVDGRGTVNTHGVGGPSIPPEELAIGRRHTDECLLDELHVLALPVEVDGDGRGIGRSRTTGTAARTTGSTTRRTSGTAGTAGRNRGHLALPDQLPGQFVEGHQHRFFPAGG